MNNNKNEVVFTGYLAEVIRLQAEKKGITPEAYILSFFEKRCNAPRRGENARGVETKPQARVQPALRLCHDQAHQCFYLELRCNAPYRK